MKIKGTIIVVNLVDHGGYNMYAIGDITFYGINGLCKIKDIREETFKGETQLYYILQSTLYPSMTLYHPVHSENSKMQKVISPEMANQILDVFKNDAGEWPERNAVRSQQYKAVTESDDHLKIAQFLNTILRKQVELTELGKKLPAQDAQMAQQISTILYDELSISLKTSKDRISQQIQKLIETH